MSFRQLKSGTCPEKEETCPPKKTRENVRIDGCSETRTIPIVDHESTLGEGTVVEADQRRAAEMDTRADQSGERGAAEICMGAVVGRGAAKSGAGT